MSRVLSCCSFESTRRRVLIRLCLTRRLGLVECLAHGTRYDTSGKVLEEKPDEEEKEAVVGTTSSGPEVEGSCSTHRSLFFLFPPCSDPPKFVRQISSPNLTTPLPLPLFNDDPPFPPASPLTPSLSLDSVNPGLSTDPLDELP